MFSQKGSFKERGQFPKEAENEVKVRNYRVEIKVEVINSKSSC